MEKNKKIQGLGGWLILIGINVVVSPIVLLHALVSVYIEILSKDSWIWQSTPGQPLYNPTFKTLVIAEVGMNVGLFFISLYLVQQFFGKKMLFPRLYSVFLIFSFLFLLSDMLVFHLIFPELKIVNRETLWFIIRAGAGAAICVPYLKYSERVKNTFIVRSDSKE